MVARNTTRSALEFLEDIQLSINSKEENTPEVIKPPKLRGKHSTNLEYIASGPLLSVASRTPNSFPSRLYNRTLNFTYYEQCFYTLGKLGEGSFGSVIKVISKEDSKFYAIKIWKEPFRNNRDRKLKLSEVNSHMEFTNHPNIVTLYEAWEEERYLYMRLELCRNSLASVGALSEEQCWEVLADICSALHVLHEAGRGHFDVKVENILYGYDNRYKLADFGLVFKFGENKKVTPNEGDAKYLAPELLHNYTKASTNFTSKADIFSLGISILELGGNLQLPSNGVVWDALRNGAFPYEQTKHLSDSLFFLITRMMARDVGIRPSASDILSLPEVQTVIRRREFDAVRRNVDVALLDIYFLRPYLSVWVVFCCIIYLCAKELTKKPPNNSSTLSRFEGFSSCGWTDSRFTDGSSHLITSTPLVPSNGDAHLHMFEPSPLPQRRSPRLLSRTAGSSGFCSDLPSTSWGFSKCDLKNAKATKWFKDCLNKSKKTKRSSRSRSPLSRSEIVPSTQPMNADDFCLPSTSKLSCSSLPFHMSPKTKEAVRTMSDERKQKASLIKKRLFATESDSDSQEEDD